MQFKEIVKHNKTSAKSSAFIYNIILNTVPEQVVSLRQLPLVQCTLSNFLNYLPPVQY